MRGCLLVGKCEDIGNRASINYELQIDGIMAAYTVSSNCRMSESTTGRIFCIYKSIDMPMERLICMETHIAVPIHLSWTSLISPQSS